MITKSHATQIKQEILWTLYLTGDLHRAGPKVEGMWHDGSKIMKCHVCYLQDQTELLDGCSLASAAENNSEKLFHSVHQYVPFYLT